MRTNGTATLWTGTPVARRVADRVTAVGDDDSPRGARLRVLRWSGPDGWRDARPRLVPRGTRPPEGSDAGFSLIELMVVMLIIAILLSIAIPTFLGTTASADDRSAQSDLVSAFTAAKTQFQNGNESYDINGSANAVALAGALEADDLQLQFTAGSLGACATVTPTCPPGAQGSSGSADDISVAVSADGVGVVLASFSVPGNCFYVVDNTGPLSTAAVTLSPYTGTPVTNSATPAHVSGSLGLPTAEGTWYVGVTGDTDKSDCNAFTPAASGANATARYQRDGFPA